VQGRKAQTHSKNIGWPRIGLKIAYFRLLNSILLFNLRKIGFRNFDFINASYDIYFAMSYGQKYSRLLYCCLRQLACRKKKIYKWEWVVSERKAWLSVVSLYNR
jgi:hypothetical protein